MKKVEAAVIFAQKVILTTSDVYGDWLFVIHLLVGYNYSGCSSYEYHSYLGLIAIIFPSISVLFQFHHWWEYERKINGGAGRSCHLHNSIQFAHGKDHYSL